MSNEQAEDQTLPVGAGNAAAVSEIRVEGVVPLDAQLGAENPKTTPDSLQGPLFEPQNASPQEISAAGGDAARLPALATFAVLDAGKVANLPELLAASELKHRCLFKGAAGEELKSVAPWLVQLEDGNRFSRNLLTRGTAPWQLWDNAPGILLRSRASFEEIWKHLRRFTRVRGPSGDWLYWRFWEAGALAELLASWEDCPEKPASLMTLRTNIGQMPISFFCPEPGPGLVRILSPGMPAMTPRTNAPFALSQEDRRVLARWRAARFDQRLLSNLTTTYPRLGQASTDRTAAWLATVIAGAEAADLRQETAIEDFAHSAYLLSDDPRRHGETMHFFKDRTLHQNDRARLARRAAEAYAKTRNQETPA